jgi:hypothetical protein
MRLRSRIIALLCLAAASAAAIVAVTSKPEAPVEIALVSVAELGTAKRVTAKFRRCNPVARFAEAHRLQHRVAGRWQPSENFPEFEDGCLLARTNCERVVLIIPIDADACRFSLGYRVGRRPYCQAYFFLQRHGIFQKLPELSRRVLKCVPRQPRLRRVECELVIPMGTHRAVR